jgi:NDP-sugar pyrophosphorylase family protein
MRSRSDVPVVRQAVILAGGQGSRLKPFTDTRPKPMIEIAGRCIIDHQIQWLAGAGVTHVTVSAGHLHEVLIEHLTSNPQPLRVDTVVEDEPLGRGGGLKYAGKHLPEPASPWYALNGDIWTRFDLTAMAAHHAEREAVATIGLARPRIPWGVVELDDLGRVTDFIESPPSPYPINGGIYVFSGEILDLLPDVGDHERSTFPLLAKQRRLAGFPIEGYWRAIDTAKDIREAAKELSQERS